MQVRLPDGAELYYVIDDFTDPWTTPHTVVLHHGMAKNHRLWYAWVPILARQFRVVRFDARGMGQSSVPEPSYPWSLEHFAEDLRDLLDQLELERVHLIGETVGGTISLRFASLYPERLLSLTTCTSPIDFADPHHLETAAWVEREGVRAWVERTITRRLDPEMADPAYIRWYADQMAATAPHVVGGFMRATPGVDLEALKKINDNWRPAELATTSCDATEGLMRYTAWLVHCALCLGVPHSAHGRRRTSVALARRMVRKQSWPSED
jgi:3-oxoadipate enol-lactonase